MNIMINREILKPILDKLQSSHKIIIIYGARQVGKTTLANQIIEKAGLKTLSINADEMKYNEILSSRDLKQLKSLVSGYELLFIDEAQRIKNIGINLKIISDNIKDLKIIVTGSSSFDLSNKIKEPLTGRTWTYNLFPLSYLELSQTRNEFELKDLLGDFLVFGAYPEIFLMENSQDRKKLLEEISSSYLYKDILELDYVKKSDKIYKLLKLLAYQIGQEISINELANNLGLGNKTVEKYIDLLEKSFVIFRLTAFSKNLRKEIAKKNKIYFYDLGIRNALIDNLKPLSDRNDRGQLFENFLVIERLKRNSYREKIASSYFWRVYTGGEIDYVEEAEGRFAAFEFKYNKDNARRPEAFFQNYQPTEFRLINKDNFLEFVL